MTKTIRNDGLWPNLPWEPVGFIGRLLEPNDEDFERFAEALGIELSQIKNTDTDEAFNEFLELYKGDFGLATMLGSRKTMLGSRKSVFCILIFAGLQSFALELSQKFDFDTDAARTLKESKLFKALRASAEKGRDAETLNLFLTSLGIPEQRFKIAVGAMKNYLNHYDTDKNKVSHHHPIAEHAFLAALVAGASRRLPVPADLPGPDEDRAILEKSGLLRFSLELIKFALKRLQEAHDAATSGSPNSGAASVFSNPTRFDEI